MINIFGPTVLYQHMISPEVSSGEEGDVQPAILLTVTKGHGEYIVWLMVHGEARRISHTRDARIAKIVYDSLKEMPYEMVVHHWIEAAFNV